MQVGILRMFQQFLLFEQYKQRLSGEVGAEEANRIVNGALVLITLGGNDFVNNYFLIPYSARSRQFTVPQYCTYLISQYRNILTVILSFFTFFHLKINGLMHAILMPTYNVFICCIHIDVDSFI